MTSPAITKSDEKPAEKKSPSRSEARPPSRAEACPATAVEGVASAAERAQEAFGWLRVFKMADMLLRQGC